MKITEVYVVAIQKPGGGLLTNSEAFCIHKNAEEKLARDRAHNIEFTRIFTLRIKDLPKDS